MILREPISLTFVLIAALIFAVNGLVFKSFWTIHERDCHAANSLLQLEHREGPLNHCGGSR